MIIIDKNDIEGITLLSKKEAWDLPRWILANSDWWWLRSCGNSRDEVVGVGMDGAISYDYEISNPRVCVRPALEIKTLPNLEIGDLVEVLGRKSQYIGNNTVLLCEPIACHEFDDETNDYDKSAIKSYIENWLKKEKKYNERRGEQIY